MPKMEGRSGLRRGRRHGILAAMMLPDRFPVRRGLALVLALLLAGCAGGEPAAPSAVTMEILSLPRGCVVEMNGEYIGTTPVKVDVPATPEGRWGGAPGFTHAISVSTPNNRAVETRKWRSGDQIPRRVLFRPPYASYLTGAAS